MDVYDVQELFGREFRSIRPPGPAPGVAALMFGQPDGPKIYANDLPGNTELVKIIWKEQMQAPGYKEPRQRFVPNK